MKFLIILSLFFGFSLHASSEEECDMSVDKEVITLVIEATKKIQACIEKESVKDCLKEDKFDFKINLLAFNNTDGVTACDFFAKDKVKECRSTLNILFKDKYLKERKNLLAGQNRFDYFNNFVFSNVFFVPSDKMLRDDVVIEPCFKAEHIESINKFLFELLFVNYNDKYRLLPAVTLKRRNMSNPESSKTLFELKKTRFIIDEIIYKVPPVD